MPDGRGVVAYWRAQEPHVSAGDGWPRLGGVVAELLVFDFQDVDHAGEPFDRFGLFAVGLA